MCIQSCDNTNDSLKKNLSYINLIINEGKNMLGQNKINDKIFTSLNIGNKNPANIEDESQNNSTKKIKDIFSNNKNEDIKLLNKDNLNKNNIMDTSKNEIIIKSTSESKASLTPKEKNNKDDIMELSQDKIDNLDISSLYSMIKSQFKLQEKKYEEKILELNGKLSEQKKENERKMTVLEKDISNLKAIIGSIQIREYSKNFLNIFKRHLNRSEEDEIKSDNRKRGAITLNAINRAYKDYKGSENFDIVAELVKCSGKTLNDGNERAHSLNIKQYEEEIKSDKKKFSVSASSEEELGKILFLNQIGASDKNFVKCYNFINKYCLKNMSEAILRGDSIDLFIKSNKQWEYSKLAKPSNKIFHFWYIIKVIINFFMKFKFFNRMKNNDE